MPVKLPGTTGTYYTIDFILSVVVPVSVVLPMLLVGIYQHYKEIATQCSLRARNVAPGLKRLNRAKGGQWEGDAQEVRSWLRESGMTCSHIASPRVLFFSEMVNVRFELTSFFSLRHTRVVVVYQVCPMFDCCVVVLAGEGVNVIPGAQIPGTATAIAVAAVYSSRS